VAILLLKPGDWLRTDVRGCQTRSPYAWSSRTGVILRARLGWWNLVKPTQIKLLEGQLEVSLPKNATLELLGPQGQKVAVKGTQRYRARQGKARPRWTKEPLWLKGFKGTTSNESIGGIGSRKWTAGDVPLNVSAITRSRSISATRSPATVIEESFVNHTDTLTGRRVPLPRYRQDASISGFGHVDRRQPRRGRTVVEKTGVGPAGDLPKTILREKARPRPAGVVGPANIFKAPRLPDLRPTPRSASKITYTQVAWPLKGNKYRYSYGLAKRDAPAASLARSWRSM